MNIKESSTGRIYKHLTDDNSFAIVSGCKNGDGIEEHQKNMSHLKNEVYNKYKLGFIELTSKWIDEEGNVFDEFALLIPNATKELAITLGEEYSQYTVIYGEDGKVEEICVTPFDGYSNGDTVRTFNLNTSTPMNISLAKEIISKSRMGAVSVPKKGGKAFTLTELYEVIPPKASMYQTKPALKSLYNTDYTLLHVSDSITPRLLSEDIRNEYCLVSEIYTSCKDRNDCSITDGYVCVPCLSYARAMKLSEKYHLDKFCIGNNGEYKEICVIPYDIYNTEDVSNKFTCSSLSEAFDKLDESKRYKKVQRSLYGDPTGKIRTFAIMSPENPIGAIGNNDNLNWAEDYVKYLRDSYKYDPKKFESQGRKAIEAIIRKTGDAGLRIGGYKYIPISGYYGEREHSMIIFNLSLRDAKMLAHDYGQESFFFGNVFPTYSDIAYFKTENHCHTYELVEVSRTVTNETDANQYFSKFGTKFRINMKAFDDDIPEITNISAFESALNNDGGHAFLHDASDRRKAYAPSPSYVKLTEATLNRLVKGHDKDGYIILSASRGDKTEVENNRRFEELKQKVWNLGYSYIPVFGGYSEEEHGEVFEKSLFVLAKNKKEAEVDFDKFVEDMTEIGSSYEQDSILVKYPDKAPMYLNLSTGEFDRPFDGDIKLNDITQMYFTALKKWNADKYGDKIQGKPQRYTYTFKEVYLSEQPKTISGAHRRSSNGEIVFYDTTGRENKKKMRHNADFFDGGHDWWITRVVREEEGPDADGWDTVWQAVEAKNEDGEVKYFVMEEDSGYADWGPLDTPKEAVSWLIHKWDEVDEPEFELDEGINERKDLVEEDEVDDTVEEKTVSLMVDDDCVDCESAPKTPEDNGIALILNGLIKSEWDAINDYNSAITSIREIGFNDDMLAVLEDIVKEENVHVGQLQELMKKVSSNANSIASGEVEAAEQLTDETKSETPSESSLTMKDEYGNDVDGMFVDESEIYVD